MPKEGVAGVMNYEKYKMDCHNLRPRDQNKTLKKNKKTETARSGTRRGSPLSRACGIRRTKKSKLQGAERDAAVHWEPIAKWITSLRS